MHDARPTAPRIAGALILTSALASLGFMLMHPAVQAHDPAGFLDEMAREARIAAIVHAALIALMFVALVGFLGLADALADRPTEARAGAVAFSLGAVAHTAAATINGFVVQRLAARYAGGGDEAFETLRPLLALCREANTAAAQLGVVAMSCAILFWSLALVRRPGAARAVGAFGLLAGGALVAITIGALLPMDVHGFTIRILLQSAWWIVVGALLIARERLHGCRIR